MGVSMAEKKQSSYEVVEVATQTTQVFQKDGEQTDIHGLLAEIANDIKEIKKELVK